MLVTIATAPSTPAPPPLAWMSWVPQKSVCLRLVSELYLPSPAGSGVFSTGTLSPGHRQEWVNTLTPASDNNNNNTCFCPDALLDARKEEIGQAVGFGRHTYNYCNWMQLEHWELTSKLQLQTHDGSCSDYVPLFHWEHRPQPSNTTWFWSCTALLIRLLWKFVALL